VFTPKTTGGGNGILSPAKNNSIESLNKGEEVTFDNRMGLVKMDDMFSPMNSSRSR
jgi:hypothetical protein